MESRLYDKLYEIEKTNWWYVAKRDLFKRALKKLNRNFSLSLDVGCGVGSNLEVLEVFSKRAIGVDISKKAINFCKKKGFRDIHYGDITKLKYKNNTFDLVLCSDLLEHVDDKRAVREISRVLKPNGIFIFSVPAHGYLWSENDRQFMHLRRYEKKRLRELLRTNNLKIIKLSYWNFFLFFPYLIFSWVSDKILNNKEVHLFLIPAFLNKILYNTLKMEFSLFDKFSPPQGTSLIGVCTKD